MTTMYRASGKNYYVTVEAGELPKGVQWVPAGVGVWASRKVYKKYGRKIRYSKYDK